MATRPTSACPGGGAQGKDESGLFPADPNDGRYWEIN